MSTLYEDGLRVVIESLGSLRNERDRAIERGQESFDNANRGWAECRTQDARADKAEATLAAVVKTALEASEGKCIACRQKRPGWATTGLCSDCNLKSISHGMPR